MRTAALAAEWHGMGLHRGAVATEFGRTAAQNGTPARITTRTVEFCWVWSALRQVTRMAWTCAGSLYQGGICAEHDCVR